MNLDPAGIPDLRLRVRAVFEWLRAPRDPDVVEEIMESGHGHGEQSAGGDGAPSREKRFGEEYGRILRDLRCAAGRKPDASVTGAWRGLGLERTPLLLLSGMAPGADQLVAEVAAEFGCRVEVPLPFPRPVMEQATTYAKVVSPWLGASVIDRHDSYRIHLAGDAQGQPSDADFADMASSDDPRWRAERRRRYRAVGEYIAVHSDLLIAVDEFVPVPDRPDPKFALDLSLAGTASAIHARRAGPSPGLLPGPTGLDWSDNGPTVLLPARRIGADSMPTPGVDVEVPSVQVQHPFLSLSVGPHAEHLRKVGVEDWRRFDSFAVSLERLNREAEGPEAGKALDAMLPSCPRRRYSGPTEPAIPLENVEGAPRPGPGPVAAGDSWRARLAGLAAARVRVAEPNRRVDASVKALRQELLKAGLALVILLQVAELWIPDEGQGRFAVFHHGVRCVAGVVSLGLFLQALYRLRRDQGKLWSWVRHWMRDVDPAVDAGSLFHRQEDTRALAEGLRVQFYWSAAGVGESVASTYLLRARGDLQWIRSAIAAHGLPYERDRDRFHDLPLERQVRLLESVRWGWLQGQADYFGETADRFSRELAEAEFRATYLATAGFVGLLLPLVYHLTHASLLVHFLPWPVALLLAALSGIAARMFLEAPRGLVERWSQGRASGQALPEAEAKALEEWLHRLHGAGWPCFLGVVLGAGTIVAIHALAPNPLLPTTLRLSLLLSSVCFAFATFRHLESQWRFLEENIHRYRGMRPLFTSADQRLAGIVQLLRGVTEHSEAHGRLIAEAHSILSAVGRDALDENSDWYVLHRIHPLKPVSPH